VSLQIFLLVIGAAFLHATWNAWVKGAADKWLNMAAVVLGHGVFGILCFTVVPLPDPASWPYVIASVALHLGYQLFLLASYRIGDLTQVYPIARGSAPLIVALVTVVFLGAELSRTEMLAVLLIGISIASLGLVRRADGLRNGNAAALALTTGGFIAAYSLVDGIGGRLAGTAVGFYSAIGILNALCFLLVLAIWQPRLLPKLPGASGMIVFGGGASFAAYAMVVYAFTQAPIALVTALRETSIVFALLFGVFFLKERLDLYKLASTAMTLTGAALLRIGK